MTGIRPNPKAALAILALGGTLYYTGKEVKSFYLALQYVLLDRDADGIDWTEVYDSLPPGIKAQAELIAAQAMYQNFGSIAKIREFAKENPDYPFPELIRQRLADLDDTPQPDDAEWDTWMAQYEVNDTDQLGFYSQYMIEKEPTKFRLLLERLGLKPSEFFSLQKHWLNRGA